MNNFYQGGRELPLAKAKSRFVEKLNMKRRRWPLKRGKESINGL